LPIWFLLSVRSLTEEHLRALKTLCRHPGVDAKAFSRYHWPGRQLGKGARCTGGKVLRALLRRGLAEIRWSSNLFRNHTQRPPERLYFPSKLAYEAVERWP
jgi:hypothetical protein